MDCCTAWKAGEFLAQMNKLCIKMIAVGGRGQQKAAQECAAQDEAAFKGDRKPCRRLLPTAG